MIPQDSKRGADGLTRLGRIEYAGQLLAAAREQAAALREHELAADESRDDENE